MFEDDEKEERNRGWDTVHDGAVPTRGVDELTMCWRHRVLDENQDAPPAVVVGNRLIAQSIMEGGGVGGVGGEQGYDTRTGGTQQLWAVVVGMVLEWWWVDIQWSMAMTRHVVWREKDMG
jgi:hypothetical protein